MASKKKKMNSGQSRRQSQNRDDHRENKGTSDDSSYDDELPAVKADPKDSKPQTSRKGFKNLLSSDYVPSNALVISDLVDLSKFRQQFSSALKLAESSTVSNKWLSSIPQELYHDQLKDTCHPSHLYARATAMASQQPGGLLLSAMHQNPSLAQIVTASVPPGALEPTPQQATLRSVLLFRDELSQRSAQPRSSKASVDASSVSKQKYRLKHQPFLDSSAKSNKNSSKDLASSNEQAIQNSDVDHELSFQEPFELSDSAPRGPHHHPPVANESANVHLAEDDELVLTVRVYRPFMAWGSNQAYKTCLLGEYVLLGCQTLAHLRDVIICDFDYASLAGDLSEYPTAITRGLPLARDRYPSAYFMFNEVFYDDLRREDAKSLSACVVEHAHAHGQPNFRLSPTDMASTRIDSLVIKLGYPYLYVHQGNCEHLVVITDVRLFNEHSDCRRVACYPVVLQRRRHYRRPCMCCWRLGAKFAVSNCSLCPEDPTLMCGSCVDRLLYDEKGRKMTGDAGHFKLYALPSVALASVPVKNDRNAGAGDETEPANIHAAILDTDARDLLDQSMPRDEDDDENGEEDDIDGGHVEGIDDNDEDSSVNDNDDVPETSSNTKRKEK